MYHIYQFIFIKDQIENKEFVELLRQNFQQELDGFMQSIHYILNKIKGVKLVVSETYIIFRQLKELWHKK